MLIKKKLPITIVLLVSIPLLMLCSIYYIYISGELRNANLHTADKIIDMEKEHLNDFFKTKIMEVDYLSKAEDIREYLNIYNQVRDREDTKVKNYHKEISERLKKINDDINKPEIRDAFILSLDGIIVAGGNPDSYWIDLSEREYFSEALKGKDIISSLVKDKVYGESVIFVASPIFDMDKVIGVMVNLIDMEATSKSIFSIVDKEVGIAYLIDEYNRVVFHEDKDMIGKKIKDNGILKKHIDYRRIEGTNWRIVIEQDLDKIMEPAYRALVVMLNILFITLLLSIILSIRISKTLTRPLTELTRIINSNRNADEVIKFDYSLNNEYGQLASSFNKMMEELSAAEEELRINNEKLENTQYKYNLALYGSKVLIWEWDLLTNDFFASENWDEFFKTDNIKNISDIPFSEYLNNDEIFELREHIELIKTGKKNNITYEFSVYEDGLRSWYRIQAGSIFEEGNISKITGTVFDITYNKDSQEKIMNLAFIDQLTNLPNKTSFDFDLDNTLQSFEKVALYMLDIDDFKRINDTLGHSVGDLIITELADRIKKLGFDIYRFSGDEFAIIVKDYKDISKIQGDTLCIYNELLKPFTYKNRELNINISCGVSLFPEDGKDSEELIQNADTALFTAKKEGKARTVFYNRIMSEKINEKLEVEGILRNAIKDGLISMHLQPQFRVFDKELLAFEALMRIKTKDGKFISPAKFIPIAEETGLIIELGEWAIKDAISKICVLKENNYNFKNISVNISGIQLKNTMINEFIVDEMKRANLEPELLEIEITESVFVDSSTEVIDKLLMLKNKGFKIALDDFGTGYSSLNYLKNLPITSLKVDKSFIDSMEDNSKSLSLVKQIITLGRELGFLLIAEGVETKEQYDILKRTECDLIQGYYFSKPLPFEEVLRLMGKSEEEL